MVERQYEQMKRERTRQADEPNTGKAVVRSDENGLASAATAPSSSSSSTAAAANSTIEAHPNEQEVGFILIV